MKERWPGIVLIICLLVVWEFVVTVGIVQTPSLPKVSQIFSDWYHVIMNGEIIRQLLPSLKRMFLGYFLAISVGMVLGLLMGTSKLIYELFEPITELIRPIPSAAYIPVAILFLGIGDEMKVFVIFLSCVFPVLISTLGGVRGVDQILIDTGRTFGKSKGKILRKIILPSVYPEIFSGMRISLAVSLIVVVVAEMIAGNNGIGYFIFDSQQFFRVGEMFCGIFTLAIVGYSLNSIFLKIEKRVLRWRHIKAK